MNETTKPATEGELFAVPEALHIGDGAIRHLVRLGAEAAGFEIASITNISEAPGLPQEIPIGISRGTKPEAIDLSRFFEPYREHPRRRQGVAEMLTLDSFIDHVEREKSATDSVVFADTDWRQPSFTAVHDYHDHQIQDYPVPGFGRFRTLYKFPLSDAWKIWVKNDGESMSQHDFAAFLEDRIAELSSPTEAEAIELERLFETKVASPSELIRLSRGLQVNVDTKVKAFHTLQTGEAQVMFEEGHVGADGQPLKVPGLFILDVAPFFMGSNVRIPVRLRYRLKGGAVVWFYQLYRPDLHVTDRVRADLDIVRARTGLLALEGKPEMSATG